FGPISGMFVSPDGKRAVTLAADRTVRTWEVETTTEERRFSLPVATTFGQMVGPTRALLHAKDGSLSVWDIEKQKEHFKIPIVGRGEEERHVRCDISRDGRSVLVVEYCRQSVNAASYDLETGKNRSVVARRWSRKEPGKEEHLVSHIYSSAGHRAVATMALPV